MKRHYIPVTADVPGVSEGTRSFLRRVIRTALADGRERHAGWVEQADVVLADVPCSGLGIIRKKPDIRWKDPAQLAQLPANIRLRWGQDLYRYEKNESSETQEKEN